LCYLITNRAVTTVADQSNHMKPVVKYNAETFSEQPSAKQAPIDGPTDD